jgi:hypothetical protein
MDSDTQFQLLCLVPMGVVFVLAVLCSWAHPGPDPTPQERARQREQAEELMGELLWLDQYDRDHGHKK